MSNGDKLVSSVPEKLEQGDFGQYFTNRGGMTLREHYAGLAMQGLLANPEAVKASVAVFGEKAAIDGFSRAAVEHADALLEALNEN
jgi:hypothetical protein